MKTLSPNVARLKKQTDRQIADIVRRRLSGHPINIMDIGKVYKAGYEAIAAGTDLESAVVARYLELSEGVQR